MDKESLRAILEFVIDRTNVGLIKFNEPIFTKIKTGAYHVTMEVGVADGAKLATLAYDFDLKKLSDEEILSSISQSLLDLFGIVLSMGASMTPPSPLKEGSQHSYVV